MTRGIARWALAAAVMAYAYPAVAKPPTEAEELFRKGHTLYDEGKLEQACAMLARSQELEPSVGTLGLLAACEEKRGLLAHAYEHFNDTARLAHAASDKREGYALDRASALLPKVPRLVIRVDAAGPPARVERAGQVVPAARLGTELMVDPGTFEVVATSADGAVFRRSLTAAPGDRLEVAIPSFKPAAPPVPVEHPVARAFAYVTGGLGIAGLAVGAGFGARAMARNSASKDPKICPPQALTCAARDEALTAATLSTVGFSIGVAGIGAGTALFIVSRPSPPESAVSLAITPRFVSLTGKF